jgi:hypothetical protein
MDRVTNRLGANNATSTGLSLTPGSPDLTVLGLVQRKTYKRFNAIVGEIQGAYMEATTGASPRRAVQLQIGAVDTPEEGQRVLNQTLTDYVNPRDLVRTIKPN